MADFAEYGDWSGDPLDTVASFCAELAADPDADLSAVPDFAPEETWEDNEPAPAAREQACRDWPNVTGSPDATRPTRPGPTGLRPNLPPKTQGPPTET
ncbi:MAG: hypothetical protein JWM91_1564 [Rhodospirillales bacterium]|nr:hypothetical protein [Rhodospirillales bacterium]